MKEKDNIMTDHSPKTSKKEFLPEGIYIEAKPAAGRFGEQLDKYHAYLVYRDGKGNAEVIRGGPETMAENEKAEGAKGIGALIYSTVGGDIEIEAGTPLTESADRYDEDENSQTRHAIKLELGDQTPQQAWKRMKKTAQIIADKEIDYNYFPTQNSNSVVATVLNRFGLNDGEIFQTLKEKSGGMTFPGENENNIDIKSRSNTLAKDAWNTETVQDIVKKIRNAAEKLGENLKDRFGSGEKESSDPKPQSQSQPEAQLNPSSDLYPRTPDDLMTFAFKEPDSVLHILRKRPASWTAEERDLVMTDPRYWDGNLIDRDAFQNATRQHFSAVYGDEPMRKDSTGRGIDPPPRYDLPSFPQEPLDPSTGTRLGRGLEAVLKDVISRSQDQGLPAAITDLQQSLNQTRMRTASQLAQPPQPDWLATDGLFGPRTRSALQTQIARIGSKPIRQALSAQGSAQGSPPAAAPQPSASAWPAPATPPIWAKPSPKLGAQAPSQTPGSQTPRPQTRGSQTPGARTSRGLASRGPGSRDLASRAPRSSGSQSWDQDSQSQDSQSRGFQSQAGSQLAASAPSQHAPRAAPVQSPRGQAVPAKPPKRSSLLNPSGTTSRGATSRGLTSRSPGSRGSASRGPASRGLTS